jgi:hypothetical protein
VLPPPPNGRYECQVVSIRTFPVNVIRQVVIRRGTEELLWLSASGTEQWKPAKGESLGYDGTNKAVGLAFYDIDKVECAEPLSFRGPWSWHRMMVDRNVEPKNHVYDVKYDVDVRYKDKSPIGRVTVTITLRFSRKLEADPIEIFPPMGR